jgi:hypothetical protein
MTRLLICLLTVASCFAVACGAKEENSGSQPAAGPPTEAASANSQGKSLDEELARLKVSTALVIPSNQVSQLPVWSPEGDQLATRVGGRWYRVNLRQIVLNPFDWKAQKAGKVDQKESVVLAPGAEIHRWQKAQTAARANQQTVTTILGLKLELLKEGSRTSFIATKFGQTPRLIWSVEENCEGLILSPDEKYVAFVGENSGTFVVSLEAL